MSKSKAINTGIVKAETMIKKPNRIITIAAITTILIMTIYFTIQVLHLDRTRFNGRNFYQAAYTIELRMYLISAIIFVSGILLFDIIYLNLIKTSKTNKIILVLYYLVIYIFRPFASIFIVFGVFDFYLINSNYELSTNLQNIFFYIFPNISPIVIGTILFVRNKIISRRTIIDKSSE